MYDDDTTIYINFEEFLEDNRDISINLELDWLKLNKLPLNVDKTTYMSFHKRCKVEQVGLIINDNKIENVNQFCFLGIIIDEHLT